MAKLDDVALDCERRTGRTTRMLEKALAMSRDGAWVNVIGANLEQTHLLRLEVVKLNQGFDTPKGLRFFSVGRIQQALRGNNAPVLVDHYARRFMTDDDWWAIGRAYCNLD